nr:hypothetical protein [Tanacetum cinerariifolium]
MHPNRGIIADIDADKDVTLEEVKVEKNADVQGRLEESQAKVYHIDLEHVDKLLKVVNAATTTITTAAPITAATITVAPTAARRRKWVVIRDPEETATLSTIIHTEPKSKDKGKGIMVQEPKPLMKKAQIEQDEAYARELEKSKEQLEEEESKALKKQSKCLEEKAAKKQKLDEEVLVVDYEIHTENNNLFYKIIRADGSYQLFLSFLSLLKNFDREDLEKL